MINTALGLDHTVERRNRKQCDPPSVTLHAPPLKSTATAANSRRRHSLILGVVVGTGVLLSAAALLAVIANPSSAKVPDAEDPLVYTVRRGDFASAIVVAGEVECASNTEVQCRVRSQGSAGIIILKLCPEGQVVQQGDFLVQFDDADLQNQLVEQKIAVADNKAALIQAQRDPETAQKTLEEYNSGTSGEERAAIEAELFDAEETLRRADLNAQSTRRLVARGLLTQLQLSGAEYSVESAGKTVDLLRQRLATYERYTTGRMVSEHESEVAIQRANAERAAFTLELSERKRDDIVRQIENCTVMAPTSGQVNYASDLFRRDAPIVVEEGATVREGQVVVLLADTQTMQVRVRIDDSQMGRVQKGTEATIELESDPGRPLEGTLTEIAPFPIPQRWHLAPIEYSAVVTISPTSKAMRAGQRAKARVYVEKKNGVLVVPIAAIVGSNRRRFCLVRAANGWEPRLVTIG